MAKKLFITDERMLHLMDWAVQNGLAENETDYLNKIEFARTSINNVRAGTQGFRNYHIHNACRLTGASADYIFGFTNVIKRKQAPEAFQMLKQAVEAVGQELKKK